MDSAIRLIAFGLSAVSIGFVSVAYFIGRAIANIPDERLQGGQGFALHSPIMLYGAASLPFCYLGLIFLFLSIRGGWKNLLRFPNLITGLFLLPGVLITAIVIQVILTG